jgi:precorrin-2 dehydrogenase / sirohydrochlorin ferrochelatase
VSRTPAYPVNLVLAGAPALVVGAGHVALRKIEGLLAAGAHVTVVAPDAIEGVRQLVAGEPRVRWHERPYQRGEVASYRLAISATGVRAVDEQVHGDAAASHIPVNVADVPDLCTFTLPAILRRGDVQVAVSTNGRSPAMASWIRTRIGEVVTDDIASALDMVADLRRELQRAGHATEIPGWHEAFDDGLIELVTLGDSAGARALLLAKLELPDPATADHAA